MTLDALKAALDAPTPEPESFELAPGVILLLAGHVPYSRVRAAQEEAVAWRAVPTAPSFGDDVLSELAMVTATVVEPVGFGVKHAWKVRERYGLQWGLLLSRALERGGLSVTEEADAAERALALDPTAPPA